jgi:hypothetical protein
MRDEIAHRGLAGGDAEEGVEGAVEGAEAVGGVGGEEEDADDGVWKGECVSEREREKRAVMGVGQ